MNFCFNTEANPNGSCSASSSDSLKATGVSLSSVAASTTASIPLVSSATNSVVGAAFVSITSSAFAVVIPKINIPAIIIELITFFMFQRLNFNRSFFYLFTLNFSESLQVQLRRERDSNPRYTCAYTHFPGVLLQPLGHLSSRVFYTFGLLK